MLHYDYLHKTLKRIYKLYIRTNKKGCWKQGQYTNVTGVCIYQQYPFRRNEFKIYICNSNKSIK